MNDEQYEKLCEKLDALSDQDDSPQFKSALAHLRSYAEAGSIDAAEFLAELLAYDGPNHNAKEAYKWYFVALSKQGYTTNFDNQNEMPLYYLGPVGDFRNESMVSDLVTELGLETIQQLDLDIEQWIAKQCD
jgi:TPR repeat protein